MINSQSLSLNQKKKFWREHKQDRFKQMAGNGCAIFNYFLNHNDIFKFIDPFDMKLYSIHLNKMMEVQTIIFFSSVVGVFLFDKIILNRFYPNFRFREWRLTANLIKYIFWPTCIFNAFDHFYSKKYRDEMLAIQEKYKFGFNDYLKANKIFQRALAVNRLEELFQKRDKFDWSQVPQLQQ